MKSAQITIKELLSIYQRRKKYLFLPALVINLISIIGAFVMKSKYESYTTILVQRDEILNPLISYQMAVAMASEDRIRTFNEIIFSHSTMMKLKDSLYSDNVEEGEGEDEQEALESLRKHITIERRGSESFRISYTSSDPGKAQAAVTLLASEFTETILRVEGQRNEETVKFFQTKLDELKEKFESSQQKVVFALKSRIDIMPQDSKDLYASLERTQVEIMDLDARAAMYHEELDDLRKFPEALATENGRQEIYDLARADIPFAEELRTQLMKYDDLTRKYRGKYPEVVRMEEQLSDLLVRIQRAIETEITKQEPTRLELERKRTRFVEELKSSSVSQKIDQDVESDYGIYKKLYDEMKVKLEQAKTTRDLGKNASNQFMIIDPPLVPTQPTQPNRPVMIAGGLVIGLFFGFLTVVFKELLDTTIRVEKDIEVYQKPIIAFISEGDGERSN